MQVSYLDLRHISIRGSFIANLFHHIPPKTLSQTLTLLPVSGLNPWLTLHQEFSPLTSNGKADTSEVPRGEYKSIE